MANSERYALMKYIDGRTESKDQERKHTKIIDTTTLSCKHEFQATSGTQ